MATKSKCVFREILPESRVDAFIMYEAVTSDGTKHIGFLGHNQKEFYILCGENCDSIAFNPASLYDSFKEITEKFTIEFN